MCFLYLKWRSLNSGTFTCKAVDKRESDIACPGHSTSGILVIFLGIMATLFLFLLHSAPYQSYAVSANISLHHNRFPSETVVHLLTWKHNNIRLIHFYLDYYSIFDPSCPVPALSSLEKTTSKIICMILNSNDRKLVLYS